MHSLLVSYLGFYSTEEYQIHNGATPHVAYPILSIPCLLMPWWLKDPGHQQAWYWPNKPVHSVSIIKRVNSLSPDWCKQILCLMWQDGITRSQRLWPFQYLLSYYKILQGLQVHDMETPSTSLALCEGNLLVSSDFSQRASNVEPWCFSSLISWTSYWTNSRNASDLSYHVTHNNTSL